MTIFRKQKFGRTPHGVRGLKFQLSAGHECSHRRTPHGVRGLKYRVGHSDMPAVASHPSRGAWIEMGMESGISPTYGSRTPHGVRGLKFDDELAHGLTVGRTPHGVRGLKSRVRHNATTPPPPSHPSRGAWIEIMRILNNIMRSSRTPHGVRGLKYHVGHSDMPAVGRTPHGVRGLKSRGTAGRRSHRGVAPLTGCVD